MRSPFRHAAAVVAAAPVAALLVACGDVAEPPSAVAAALAQPPVAASPAPVAAGPSSDPPPAGARIDAVPLDTLSFDLPVYPGASVDGDVASRIELPRSTTLMVTLRSDDPAPQVVAFYRDALRARAEGAEFADMGDALGDGGATLVLADPVAGVAVQVQVSPARGGSSVQIVDTRARR